jgi:hypothetical protein
MKISTKAVKTSKSCKNIKKKIEIRLQKVEIQFPKLIKSKNVNKAGPKGFEPPASGLEAQRYILAKPRALFVFPITEYEMRI